MSTNSPKHKQFNGLLIQTVHGISYPRVGLRGMAQQTKDLVGHLRQRTLKAGSK